MARDSFASKLKLASVTSNKSNHRPLLYKDTGSQISCLQGYQTFHSAHALGKGTPWYIIKNVKLIWIYYQRYSSNIIIKTAEAQTSMAVAQNVLKADSVRINLDNTYSLCRFNKSVNGPWCPKHYFLGYSSIYHKTKQNSNCYIQKTWALR